MNARHVVNHFVRIATKDAMIAARLHVRHIWGNAAATGMSCVANAWLCDSGHEES